MTITLKGTLTDKLVLGNYVVWDEAIPISRSVVTTIPNEEIALPFGYSIEIAESGPSVALSLKHNDATIYSDHVPIHAVVPINAVTDNGRMGFVGSIAVGDPWVTA